MREIKFRAWREEGRKMYYDVTFDHTEVSWFDPETKQDPDDTEFGCWVIIGDRIEKSLFPYCILMQYTGLKDRGGKEIYEGDIIRTFKFIDNIVGIVQWCGHRLAWVVHPPGWHENTSEMLFHCRGHIEVIGNIYENPESAVE